MWQYWWIIFVAACVLMGAGALIWLNTAIAFTRVVSPLGRWLDKEARYNTWGVRLMMAGGVLAVIAVVLAIGHWTKV